MKFVNCTLEQITDLFGNTGLTRLHRVEIDYPENDLHIILAKTGDFPIIDKVPIQAFVSRINMEEMEVSYNKEDPLAMVFYPEAMKEQHANQEASEIFLNVSTLLHELTHVKQVYSGRLEPLGWLKMNWEGVYYEIEMKGYLAYPWEKEACMEQLEWLTRGNTVMAELCYQEFVNASMQIDL